jgi:GH15 family glucan-1,4-alpha-glucosidase
MRDRRPLAGSVGSPPEPGLQGGVVPDRYPAIEDHAVIGDLHTVALVATDGTIDWCCLPRFDSPAVFASLLDADRGGSFAVRSEAVRTRQLYMPDTNVLVTRFQGTGSVGEVVDFMVPRHDAGPPAHPGPLLVRRLRAVRGTVVFTITCRPAFDFGRQDHATHVLDHGGAVFSIPRAELVLRAGHRFSVAGPAATATVTLGPGEGLDLVLEWGGPPQPPAEGEADRLLKHTVGYWRDWLRRSRYQGRYREMVERSALVLKLLVYQPTGALIAAPTTSLPEFVGGGRNWDYRYTWIRDAAFTLYGLMRLGFTDEAAGFMTWLEARCRDAAADRGLQVLYAIDGNPEVPESVLDHLDGYQGSRPVRVGNSAAGQLQLDIYGELMDSVYLYNKYGCPIGYELWEALGRQLDWLEKHWQLPDDGIWESRGGRRRSTYSALMTWVAFERAIRIGRQRGLPAPIAHWRDMANSSYQAVQRDGWSPERRAYVQYLGGTTLDASLLVMPLVKFAGPRDPRFLATLDRIGEELVSDSLVRRYEPDGSDGLPGSEGTFNLCSFWYVEALTRAGRIAEGRYIFEKMLTHANHVGLFAEEIGPAGEALGNFPQAFTHLALISAAYNLDRALSGEPRG